MEIIKVKGIACPCGGGLGQAVAEPNLIGDIQHLQGVGSRKAEDGRCMGIAEAAGIGQGAGLEFAFKAKPNLGMVLGGEEALHVGGIGLGTGDELAVVGGDRNLRAGVPVELSAERT